MVGETKPGHPLHPRRPPLSRRQLLMQVVVAGVILASGIGIGIGGTIITLQKQNRIVWHIPTPPPERGDRPPDRERGGGIVAALQAKYSLSDEQTQQVKDVFDKRMQNARERWKQLADIETAERENLVNDMKPILTSEQFAQWSVDYQKMLDDMRNRPFWGPRGGRRGPPHGDRGPGGPMGPEGRRGGRPPRGFMDPNGRHGPDRPLNQPVEFKARPSDGNAPR